MVLNSKFRYLACLPLLFSLISSQALAEESPNDQISNEQLPQAGELVQLEEDGIEITAPIGWEVQKKFGGQSLLMREPKKEGKIDYDKPKFRRNITLAVAHEGTPVDEQQVKLIKEKMMNTFGKTPGIEAYTIGEKAQYFDYKAEKDGIILESSYFHNGFALSQIHIYVSSKEKNVLVTYTDLTDSFQSNPAAYDEAWSSITSINLEGEASSSRYGNLISKASIFGPIVALILFLITFFRMRAYKRYGEHLVADADFLDDNLLSDDQESKSKAISEDDNDDFTSDIGEDDDDWAI